MIHVEKKRYKCDFNDCNYSAINSGHLKTHKLTHTGEKPYKCDFDDCPYSTTNSSNLKRHKMIHTEEKPYKCDFNDCSYSCKSNSDLKKHKMVHTGEKPYKCDFNDCNYSTTNSGNLKTHKLTHTGEKPFSCDFEECNYSFSNFTNLKRHKMIHTEEKPYKCDFNDCSYSCRTNSDLKKHKMIHTEENPYKCTFIDCNYSSTNNSNVKRHIKEYHSKKENINSEGDKKSENRTFKALEKVFDIKRNYYINLKNIKGSWCFIDGFLIKNDIIFCIENDENQHSQRLISFETRRMIDIKSIFAETKKDIPVVFIRFNPDTYRINNIIKKIPFNIRIKEMIDLIEKILLKKDKLMPLNIVYLFYNKNNDILDIFNSIDYPEELKKCNLII